ncbi:YcjF family protein [Cyanobium sp. ATX 6A2]|uniref:YcjF family protein n=1 Tax=Cyanobium sp. ATX 6A2 TaxID=2823700 RepID=UPI0020CCBBDD|nr:YcjF family protein [Cyanobium sp. ATX 6A2]MCP9888797.1 YcjF family protein [Cyanobium sp. ATX 6A2]
MAAATAAGGLALDGLGRLAHGSLLSTAAAAAALGALWWLRPAGARPGGPAPADVGGWLERLEALEARFEELEPSAGSGTADPAPARRQRQLEFASLRSQLERSGLHLAVVGHPPQEPAWRERLAKALQGPESLTLHWARPLPASSELWQWPEPFASCDALLYCLSTPLMAADLRWLEALPRGQPLWLLLHADGPGQEANASAELLAQLSLEPPPPLLGWRQTADLAASLQPLARLCASEAPRLRGQRQLRSLETLHGRWQGDLELLRRSHFQALQQRTQWLVAAGVVAAPLPSLDLLVLAVANGLMVKEMAQLWGCPWSGEQLRAVAVELARASLTLGVVEWSTQALAGAVKWHGATWLLGSAVQALSAAYLTRVVGGAMADSLARSVGVAEPDLERLRREAPLLVARAAERERIDWPAFLRQGQQWLGEQWLGEQVCPPLAGRKSSQQSA